MPPPAPREKGSPAEFCKKGSDWQTSGLSRACESMHNGPARRQNSATGAGAKNLYTTSPS
jgi:hypothetical protein